LKTAWAIGVFSEVLFVVGVALIAWGVYKAASSSIPMGSCTVLICVVYTRQIILSDFYLGLGLLIASAIGFLFTLWSYRRASIPQGETPN
jgi:hypothetical protein